VAAFFLRPGLLCQVMGSRRFADQILRAGSQSAAGSLLRMKRAYMRWVRHGTGLKVKQRGWTDAEDGWLRRISARAEQ
jgi:hypothetical protein